MTTRMRGWYFEEFEVGQQFRWGPRAITQDDVAAFSRLTGDFNPLHENEEFAARSVHGGKIVQGALLVSLVIGITAQVGLFEGTALGLLEIRWRFKKPLKVGDSIRCEMSVIGKSPTSKPDRGVITRHYSILNGKGDVVSEGELAIMVRRRSAVGSRGEK
ncbi:MAG: MaoC family dehydratase N-terminal domain-containing protein [Acidobacteria bacterium]|nr:MaoC family dehydratase N-terminal domain-containing protein [Acidobacteriota bacterium]